jgi:hypothetical protein
MNFYKLPSGEVAGFDTPEEAPEGATEITETEFSQIATATVLTLEQVQATQIAALTASYAAAIQQPVSYTSKGGITKTYQASTASVDNLTQMLLAFQASQTVPEGFYWVSEDNTQVSFTYADMQALANALGTQGAAMFVQLQTLKGQVNAATDVAAVQAVVW